MEHKEIGRVSRLDSFLVCQLRRLGRSVSRRQLLTRTWRLILSVLGISLIPVLPVDRAIRNAEARSEACNDWRNCGLCGVSCADCGGSIGGCPSACSQTLASSGWEACCCNDTGFCRMIQFRDCCTSSPSACQSCLTAEFCSRACPQDEWCPSGTEYRCTKAVITGLGC